MHILKAPLKTGFIVLSLLVFCPAILAQEAPSPVEKMVQAANDRIASGESPDEVEQSLKEGIDDQGLKAETAPPRWDVFARTRWENNESTAQDKSPNSHDRSANNQAVFVMGANHPAD